MKTLDSPLPNPPSVIVHDTFRKLLPRRPIRGEMKEMPAIIGTDHSSQRRCLVFFDLRRWKD